MIGDGALHQERSIYQYNDEALREVIVASIAVTISAIAVSLRCYVRARIVKIFTLDDWLLVASQMISFTVLPIWWYMVQEERNYAPRSPELFDNLAWTLFVSELLYAVSNFNLKASCAIFFLRTAQTRRQRWLYIGAVINFGVFYTIACLVATLRCSPFSVVSLMRSTTCNYNWDVTGPLIIAATAMNSVTDCMFALIPLYKAVTTSRIGLWRSLCNKPSICFIALIGLGGSFISLARLASINDIQPSERIFETTPKPFRQAWLETALCTVALSLLTVRPLLDRLRKRRNRGSFDRKAKEYQPPILTLPIEDSVGTHNGTISRQDSGAEMPKRLGLLPDTTISMLSCGSDSEPTSPEKSFKVSRLPETRTSAQSLDLELGPSSPARKGFPIPRLGILPEPVTAFDSEDIDLTFPVPIRSPPSRRISKSQVGRRMSTTLLSVTEVKEEN